MKKHLLSPLFGLLVVVISSLAMTTSAGAFTLHNLWYGSCLGVAGGNPTPGTKMIMWSCDGSANQQFFLGGLYHAPGVPFVNSDGEQLYTLNNEVAVNRRLGVVPNGPSVTIWTADGSANQQWTMTPVFTDVNNHECYAIRSNGANTMLTPVNNNNSMGGHSYQAYYLNNGQLWYVNEAQDYGGNDGGQAVVASPYVWFADFTLNGNWYAADNLPLYEYANYFAIGAKLVYAPQSYSAQYWCMY